MGVDVYTVHLHRPAGTERNPVPFCRSTKGYRAQSFKPEVREAVWLMKAGSPPMVRLGATGFTVPLESLGLVRVSGRPVKICDGCVAREKK